MNKLRDFILSNKVFSKCSEQEKEEIKAELERYDELLEAETQDLDEELWQIVNSQCKLNAQLFQYIEKLEKLGWLDENDL